MRIPFFSSLRRSRPYRTRRNLILEHLDLSRPGLEIGPGPHPLVPKRDGHPVKTLDWMDQEGLQKRCREEGGGDPQNIEFVDFVWQGEPYAELIGEEKAFEWIVASHVVEHVPDLVAFLRNCSDVLSDQGILSLAVPDKRYCFDHFRTLSSLSQVIDAHLQNRTRHTTGTLYEYLLHTTLLNGTGAWGKGSKGTFALSYPRETPEEMYLEKIKGPEYIDAHGWTFTPSSFRLLIQELNLLGFTDLKEYSFSPSLGCEFFITLSRKGKGSGLNRLELFHDIEREIKA